MGTCNRQHADTCSVVGCDRSHLARGWCKLHYQRWWTHGDPTIVLRRARICSFEGCNRTSCASGLCRMHYRRWKKHGDPSKVLLPPGPVKTHTTCLLEGCGRDYGAKGLCHNHYSALISTPKRRALKRGAEIVDFTPEQWEQIKTVFGYRCAYCGNYTDLEQDHITPLSKGGNHTAGNIVPSCRSCNSRKGTAVGQFVPVRQKVT